MERKERATIKQVARAAGVSTQTISRVINHRPDVSTETRQRVWQVIEQLGYHPNTLARSLIQQRSYTLGVVTAGLKYIGPARTLNGIAQQAEAMGYTLLLKELPQFTVEDAWPVLLSLLARQVDGLLWAVSEIGDNRQALLARLPDLPIPVVFLTMSARPGLCIVSIDDYAGGCLATRHLIAQGRRQIGHLSGPLDWWEARQRKAGWRDTLLQAGLPAPEAHCAEGNWSSASGDQASAQLFERFPEMDAVFVANDQMALSVLLQADRRGLAIPHQLAVVGFDNLPESAYFNPPLTTIDPDQYQLGRTAVQMLIRQVDPPASPFQAAACGPQALLQPRLVMRSSSGVRPENPGPPDDR